jgi:hypothetical protein
MFWWGSSLLHQPWLMKLIIWCNNKTSEWLNDRPSLKKCEILEDARGLFRPLRLILYTLLGISPQLGHLACFGNKPTLWQKSIALSSSVHLHFQHHQCCRHGCQEQRQYLIHTLKINFDLPRLRMREEVHLRWWKHSQRCKRVFTSKSLFSLSGESSALQCGQQKQWRVSEIGKFKILLRGKSPDY